VYGLVSSEYSIGNDRATSIYFLFQKSTVPVFEIETSKRRKTSCCLIRVRVLLLWFIF